MARLARLLGVASVLVLASACGGGGGGGTSAASAVSSICQKALSCGYLDPSDLSMCIDAVSEIETFIANPARTVSCVQGLSCVQLDDYE